MTTTATGLIEAPEYDVLYVTGYADSDGNPTGINADLYIREDPAAAAELAARFPKSAKVRATTLSLRDGCVTFSANLAGDDVNHGRNETGARRFRTLMAAAARLGVRVEYVPAGPFRLTAEQIAEATGA